MPGVMIERPKMTRAMYQALKRHIMRERERLKQAEQEQDEAAERMRKEREMKKKKEEEDSLTLEQTKEQLSQLQSKLESQKKDKHELFNQLKKVLQEDENKKRAMMKEHNEMVANLQYHGAMPLGPGHPGTMYMQTHLQHKPAIKYMTIPMHHHSGGHAPPSASASGSQSQQAPPHHQPTAPVPPQGIKRQRSPSPPPHSAAIYPHYGSSKYAASSTAYTQPIKQEPYSAPSEYGAKPTPKVHVKSEPGVYQPSSTHVTYASQSGHSYPPPATQQSSVPTASIQSSQAHSGSGAYQPPGVAGAGKSSPGQSAFQSYPTHYGTHQTQKPLTEAQHYHQAPGGHQVQRMPQIGIANPGMLGMKDLQRVQLAAYHQAELARVQQHKPPHMVAAATPPQLGSQAQSAPSPQQPPKGGIVSGYPVRTQGSASTYQPTSTQSVHSSSHSGATAPARHAYPGQQRYY